MIVAPGASQEAQMSGLALGIMNHCVPRLLDTSNINEQ